MAAGGVGVVCVIVLSFIDDAFGAALEGGEVEKVAVSESYNGNNDSNGRELDAVEVGALPDICCSVLPSSEVVGIIMIMQDTHIAHRMAEVLLNLMGLELVMESVVQRKKLQTLVRKKTGA